MKISHSLVGCLALLLLTGCEQGHEAAYIGADPRLPGAYHALEVAAVFTDMSHATLKVRNTGREDMCYFDAMFPGEEGARGFRVFSSAGAERFNGDTGLFRDSDMTCIAPTQVRSFQVDLSATFDGGMQHGDCVLFEFPYFRRGMADQVSYANGVPAESGGIVQAVWFVRDGELYPSVEHADCRSQSFLSRFLN